MEREPEHGNEKIKEFGRDEIKEGDLVMLEGKIYRAVLHDTGYTVRQYYSHSTQEKGPGPGWDNKVTTLEKYGVDDPSKLPDEPYRRIELEPVEKEK